MSKPKNPGYIAGNHWEICERCGQAFRSSEMMTQWDGLRVDRECFDKRHPQDAVRERDSSLCAQKSDSGGLDWAGNRNYTPDLDPVSFIQEPNDEYFTSPPSGNFGELSGQCIPKNAPTSLCSEFSGRYPLVSWFMATNRENQTTYETSQFDPETLECNDGNTGYEVFHTCKPDVGSPFKKLWTISGPMPDLTCNVVTNNTGMSYPAFVFDSATRPSIEYGLAHRNDIDKTWGVLTTGSQTPTEGLHLTWIIAFDSIKYKESGLGGYTRIIRTGENDSDYRHHPSEGLATYWGGGNTGTLGLLIPECSPYHPLNITHWGIGSCGGTYNYPSSCIEGGCVTKAACESGDIFHPLCTINSEDETFILRLDFSNDSLIAIKNSGVEVTVDSSFPASPGPDGASNKYTNILDGGYVPHNSDIQSYSRIHNDISFNILEIFAMYRQYSNETVYENEKQLVEHYLSKKYSIPIKRENFVCEGEYGN